MYAADPGRLVSSVLLVLLISLVGGGWWGCGTWVRVGGGGGWHTVGCLRDQMPSLPELVSMFLGGMWVGFWAWYHLTGVGLPLWGSWLVGGFGL